jgi:hypothetical protein
MISSTDSVYSLPLPGQLTSHGDEPVLLLRDGSRSNKEELIAQVRSGNYFVTLATLLDTLSANLTDENEAEAMILQVMVDNLIYLDENYELVKK